jgi:hypothetical protein
MIVTPPQSRALRSPVGAGKCVILRKSSIRGRGIGMAYDQQQIQAAGTNSLAIAAFVCGIASFCGLGPLAAIPAIIVGHMAMRQIRRTRERGQGLAKAGLILGYVSLALIALVFLVALDMNAAQQVPG